MATYFPSPSNQRDDLLTPYPGDQKFASYSEPPFHPGNIMMYLNQASSMSYSDILSVSTLSPVPLGNSVTGDSQVIPRTQLGFPDGEQNIRCQGLALSLGTGMPSASVASLNGQYPNPGLSSFLSTSPPISRKGEISCKGDENNQFGGLIVAECLLSSFFWSQPESYQNRDIVQSSLLGDSIEALSNRYLYEPSGFANTLLNSKYLKAAQQLLDEVANLWNALKQHRLNKHQNIHGIGLDGSKEIDGRSRSQSVQMSSDPGDSNTNSFCELSPAQRQELQDKKKKLLSMVDEVDRRYKQYYDQMQIVVSSFDMVAGCGAAEPYTALALQTISRHFRCLRDAITSQIQVTQRSLGEQDTSPYGQGGGIARLRYVDQQLKQHRALQQFGVMRHAWRPQRGLPETAVSILRAWLFEHFLHPYPKDSEKIMLAKETGLTRNQVANWFINARVRLWKPMVEEMYKEEFGESELNSQSSPENASKAPRDHSGQFEETREELQDCVMPTTADGVQPGQAQESNVNGKTARPGFGSSAHRDNISGSGTTRVRDQRPNVDDHSLYPDEIIPHRQVGGGSLMGTATTFDMLELGSFVDGSQVSLALELRHCERDGFPMSGGTNLRGNDTITSSAEPDSLDIQCLDPVKQHHRFDNSHMVYDFVV